MEEDFVDEENRKEMIKSPIRNIYELGRPGDFFISGLDRPDMPISIDRIMSMKLMDVMDLLFEERILIRPHL